MNELLQWLHAAPRRGIEIVHGPAGFGVSTLDERGAVQSDIGKTLQAAADRVCVKLGIATKREPQEPGSAF